MLKVELQDFEWQQVMTFMALAPWKDVNALLMKIGQQLTQQQAAQQAVQQAAQQTPSQPPREGNGKDAHAHE